MILLLWFATLLLAAVLCVITFVQVLYTESLRLRARELPSLEFFRSTLEDRIAPGAAEGSLAISLIKHTCLLVLTAIFFAVASLSGEPLLQAVPGGLLLAWLTMLVSTYVIPQFLYRKTGAQWLLPLTPLLRLAVIAAKPLVAVLGFFHSLVDLAQTGKDQLEPAHPSEHIEALISAGTEEGLLEEQDRKLIHSVVAFGDTTVREVMTPRPNIVAISQNASLEDLRKLVIHEQYSRIPVYDGDIDHVTGFVHVRDMFELDPDDRKSRSVLALARPMRLVPETKPVNDLLREMQSDGAHMAAVIDEYGNTAGLVTMEDLVEEIVGEIHDEHEPERDVTEEQDGSYVMAGSLDLGRLEDLLDFRPQEETESTTVGGLAAEWCGHVPQAHEIIERDGIRIEVLAANERRVEKVRVSRAEKKTHV